MNRIAGSDAELAGFDFRRRHVPMLSTIAAILLGLRPIVATFVGLTAGGWRRVLP